MQSVEKETTRVITDSGFFVLRTPALPADEFLRWTNGLKVPRAVDPDASPEQLEIEWNENVQILRARLRRLVDRPDITQALFVASPSLQLGIAQWKQDPTSKKGLQAERALVRYFTRMCTRPTPFGLFAGCSIGRTTTRATEDSALTLQARQFYKTTTRLDFDYLFALTDVLSRDRTILKELRFRPNTSLHRFRDGWHYVEATPNGNGSSRTHHLARIESHACIESALARADLDGATFSELVDAVLVHRDPDISPMDAEVLIQELIDNNVLVSPLSPLVTGESPLDDIIHQLELLPSGRQTASVLSIVRNRLAALDQKGVSANPSEYDGITSILDGLPAKFDPAWVYQVDMIKPSENVVLTPSIVDALTEAVEVLRRFDVTNNEPEPLASFRKAFVERYDHALVPLLDVLDEDSGLGFGPAGAYASTALRGLELKGQEPSTQRIHFDLVQAFLLDKIASCSREGVNEVRLKLSDIPAFENGPKRLPTSFSLWAKLIAPSLAALRAGEFEVLIINTNGPCGANSLTRFCHAEPQLAGHVRQYLRTEQDYEPDSIFAEIVHLPEGRVGNVLCRPVLRDYEIVFLGRSGAPKQCQIPASDLLVTVAENDEICLYSRQLGRRVTPRLTSAHNFYPPILSPVYSFLGLLQRQNGISAPNFSWGHLASQLFLPRITVGRIVVATARWRLLRNDIDEVVSATRWRRFIAAQELRRRRSLPRFVEYKESGDNTLLVDFDNPLSVDAFAHILGRNNQDAVLREVCPSPEQLCVTSEEGAFWHELHVPMLCRSTSPHTAHQKTTNVEPTSLRHRQHVTTRSFAPGSEWLYFKLYGGSLSLDQILMSHIRPIVRSPIAESCISQWFFIRYADPHQHLRLRFRGDPSRLQRELLPFVSESLKPLIDSGVLWKLQLDTYVREVERYGGHNGILLSEDIFCADSDAVIELLSALDPADELDSRWRLALLGAHVLLADCSFDEGEKLITIKQLRADCDRRFQIGAVEKKILGERFRTERAWVDAIRDNRAAEGWEGVWGTAMEVFQRRSGSVRNAVAKLRTLDSSGELPASMSALTSSYVHMHINRMMRALPNQHELVLYNFLFRAYDASVACSRNGSEVRIG